jgi:hypothetical protein
MDNETNVVPIKISNGLNTRKGLILIAGILYLFRLIGLTL